MNVYKVSSWLKILAWLLLAALFVKMLAMVRPDERLTSDRFAGRGRNLAIMRNVQPAAAMPAKPKIDTPVGDLTVVRQLLHENANRSWSFDEHCAPYPRLEDLNIQSEYYQLSVGGNVSYFLYSAFYERRISVDRSPSVVLLGMISSFHGPFEPAYCQVWYENSSRPELLEMTQQDMAWYDAWGLGPEQVYPALFTCPLAGGPRRHRVPQLVSLVFGDRCARASNALYVYYRAPERRRSLRFGVCVKDLQFPDEDMSERFVEWLEMVRLLGAERVTAYYLGGNTLHPNTIRTLRHYEQHDGLVELRPFRLLEGVSKPADHVPLNKRLNEVLMYNDCLYRSMYEFDYLAVMDVDELIMPLGELRNWTALVERLEQNPNGDSNEPSQAGGSNTPHCSLCFRNVYYSRELQPDETPPASFYMLRHVQRVAQHLDANSAVKCLHATAYVTALHNHFPLGWRGAGYPHDVSVALGQMQHYREPDDEIQLKEPPPVRDDNIWRFKEQLINNSLAVHRQLGWSLP
ncbi:PREDICTED: uncharacterized protein LOC108619405 [Drosophila arizonae]|uniref:Glycosyltransferase family 92 protein n=1 Tax=Drosophila arizonae TaxID=7263 RepID=A0ABM1PW76_DROAR|nr:PREDICTED: uncharacterized protein LOC108619405 [Drosophila arizonae]